MDHNDSPRMVGKATVVEEWRMGAGIYDPFGIGDKMKVKIVINTMGITPAGEGMQFRTSEIWSGELEFLEKGEYLTKISIIAEGVEHPICDVPFSPTMGYYQWIPPMIDDDELEEIEERIIENTEPI